LSSTVPRHEDSKDNGKPSQDAKIDKPKPQIVKKDPLLTTAEPAAPRAEISAELVKEDREARPKEKKVKPPKPTEEEIAAAQLKTLMEGLEALDDDKVAEAKRKGKLGESWMDTYTLERDEDFEIEREKGKLGFWAEGEESLGPDEDYHGDDITSHGHGVLEEQRDLREYARLIAWELPLLNRKNYPSQHIRHQLQMITNSIS
jgi:small subunit ribosomal protein S35